MPKPGYVARHQATPMADRNRAIWSGGLMYDDSGSIVPIPEPATALLSSLAILGLFFKCRRSVATFVKKWTGWIRWF